jgi:hypothetical protein
MAPKIPAIPAVRRIRLRFINLVDRKRKDCYSGGKRVFEIHGIRRRPQNRPIVIRVDGVTHGVVLSIKKMCRQTESSRDTMLLDVRLKNWRANHATT